ncbi:MAG TPA: TolC family outer membrane protein [Azonexus sp.]
MIRCCVLLLLLAGQAWAEPESLLRLYRDARVNYPNYLASRAEAAAEAEREAVARGRLLPNINIGGNYGRSDTTRKTPRLGDDQFEYDYYAYNLNLRQSLFRLQDWAEYRKARALSQSATALEGRADNDLVIGMVTVFLELSLLNERLRLQEAQRVATDNQLAAARRGFELGTGTRIDIDEMQARADLLLAQTYELERQRDFRQRELEGYAGRPVGELPVLDAEAFSPARLLPAGPVEKWVGDALAANNDFRLLTAQMEAAEQDVLAARSGHFPTLDFVASVGRSSNDSVTTLSSAGDVRYETSSLGLQLNVPLFAGGQVSALVRQAQARHSQARYRVEELRARLEREVRREFDNVTRGWEMIRALERAEQSARQSLRAVRKGIDAGVRSTTDLLVAEQQYVAAKVELSRGRYQLLGSVLKLKSMAGPVYDDDFERLDACFRINVKSG